MVSEIQCVFHKNSLMSCVMDDYCSNSPKECDMLVKCVCGSNAKRNRSLSDFEGRLLMRIFSICLKSESNEY